MNRSENHDPTKNPSGSRIGLKHAEDLRIAKAALGGDGRARKLFADKMKCVPKILCVMNSRMGSPLPPAELEDLSQDTLIAIWRRLDDYEGGAALSTWAHRFCQFSLMARMRKQYRRGVGMQYEEGAVYDRDANASSYDHVYRALDIIDHNDAGLVRLKHFACLSFDEIGALHRMPVSTVKANYYRAIERLRGILARDEPGVA